MKTVKLFLAFSAELLADRRDFEILELAIRCWRTGKKLAAFLARLNRRLPMHGVDRALR